MRHALLDADQRIARRVAREHGGSGAATVAACAMQDDAASRWLVAWVGDCRVYRVDDASQAAAALVGTCSGTPLTCPNPGWPRLSNQTDGTIATNVLGVATLAILGIGFFSWNDSASAEENLADLRNDLNIITTVATEKKCGLLGSAEASKK